MLKKIGIGVAVILVLLVALVVTFFVYMSGAGDDPAFFEREIVAFEEQDASQPPAPGGVVFVGSSSIRFWDSLIEDMAPAPVIQRGFGGAQMSHVLHNVHRVVTPYAPSRVVVYAGDNDLAAGYGKSADDVVSQYRQLVSEIHGRLPDAEIDFIAIKPSTRRWERWPEMNRANREIVAFAAKDPRLGYFDIATPMLGEDGTPRPELFRLDGLHVNPEGYAVWAEVVRPTVVADFVPSRGEPAGNDRSSP